jgi:hypothetical protein
VLRIRDVYPGSRIRIFSHPGSRKPKTTTKERGEKKFCHTFLCSQKFHKIENYFSFEVLKKKIWANFQRIIELFTLKNMALGSGIRKKPIPDPGVKKAPDPGSGSATLVGSNEKNLLALQINCAGLYTISELG